MSSTSPPETAVVGPISRRAQPVATALGPVGWARANLFNSWWSSAVTLLLLFRTPC